MRIDHLQRCLETSRQEYLNALADMNIPQKLSYGEILDIILNLEWVSLSSYDPLKEAMESKIYDDFSMTVNDMAFRPYYILFSPYEPEGYSLDFIYADDTAHFIEFSQFKPFMLGTTLHDFDKIKVNMPQNFDDYSGLFFQNTRGEILPFTKDSLIEHNDYLLCSIVKHKEIDLYVKIVWHCIAVF